MDFDAEIEAMSERAIALELANKRREYELEGIDGPRAESNLRALERMNRS